MSKFCINWFTLSWFSCFRLFDQIFWCNRRRTKLIIKFTSFLLKIKFNTKKTGGSKCFAIFIYRFNMATNGIFTFIDTEDGLEAPGPPYSLLKGGFIQTTNKFGLYVAII